MGKYGPLTEFLRKQRTDRVAMTFSEIERVVGFKLPRSATEYRAWWSNNTSNSVMTRAWLDAGFQSEQVDMVAGKLVFSRLEQSKPAERKKNASGEGEGEQRSLYGWLEGTVYIAPGVDLTEPADPEWGKRTYE